MLARIDHVLNTSNAFRSNFTRFGIYSNDIDTFIFFSRLNHFNVCVYQCMGLETYMIDLTHETYSSRMLRAAWKFHAYECVCVCVLSCAWKWHVSLPASLWLKLRGFFSFRKMIILPWFAIHILMISALIGIAIVFHGSATENQSTLNQSIIKTTRCQFPLMAFL